MGLVSGVGGTSLAPEGCGDGRWCLTITRCSASNPGPTARPSKPPSAGTSRSGRRGPGTPRPSIRSSRTSTRSRRSSQALLGDPSARAGYDAELAAALRAERSLRLDALQKRIRLRAAKGGLTVSDRKVLRDEAERLGLAADDLDRLAEPIPPKPEAPAALDEALEAPPDVLDPVMRRQTRVALDHLRKRDLYDALGLPRDAPLSEIAARADLERRKWMKKSQVTAEKTAWLEVVTLAQSHLTNPHSRARYNRTLTFEAEEALAESAAFALGGQPRLDPGTREVLLDEAEALGVEPDRAEKVVSRVCRRLGIARDGVAFAQGAAPGAVNGPPRLLRCRSCSGVTDYGKVARGTGPSSCRHCGESLHWSCPVCQRLMWVDEPRCTCGFRVELREPLVWHFEAAQVAFKTHDYPTALAHLQRVQEFAPKHVGARKGIEMVKQKTAEIELAESAYELARAGGKLAAARRAVDDLGQARRPVHPGVEGRPRRLESRPSARRSRSPARARARERSDPKTARELYRRGLALVAHLPEALAGLERCPPDTPDPPDRRVCRQPGPTPLVSPSPRRPGRGPLRRPAQTRGRVPAPRRRRPDRRGLGARVRGPGRHPRHLRLLRRDGRSGGRSSRSRPSPSARSSCWARSRTCRPRPVSARSTCRGRPPPTRPRSASPASAAAPRKPRSTASTSSRRSTRPTTAGWRPTGSISTASSPSSRPPTAARPPRAGRSSRPCPTRPSAPWTHRRLTPEPDGRVTLRWVEPTRGIVKLIRTVRPFPHPPGTKLAPIQTASLEGDWLELAAPDIAHDLPPSFGAFHYTPLTSWGGSITVGHSVSHSCVADPSDLRAARVGSAGPCPPPLALEPARQSVAGRRPAGDAARRA